MIKDLNIVKCQLLWIIITRNHLRKFVKPCKSVKNFNKVSRVEIFIRPVEIPKPKVYPLVLIRLPSDVKKVEHKVPNEVMPQTGQAEIHHNLPEEVWEGFSFTFVICPCTFQIKTKAYRS